MKHLPVNLASNPIEQRRWLRRVKIAAVAVALLVSVLHGLLAFSLLDTPQDRAPDLQALRELRYQGSDVLDMVTNADPREARSMAVAVGLANALIQQRTFPWAGLFTMLEQTLPDDVRLEIIQPLATVDGVRLTLTAASASGDSLLAFLGALEQRPELVAVYPGRQMIGADGDLRLSVEAIARIATVVTPGTPERP
jgi:Tfp pilus assembly protein PilN